MSIDKKVANTQESNIQTEPFYNPNGFEFTPVEEMFDKDFDVESVQGMDEYMKELNAIAPVVNDITKSLYLANVPNNMPQNSTKNFSSFEGFSKVFNSPNPFLSGQPENIQIQDPIISGAKASGYDRIAIHPDFNKLGWNPARDNEAYYNANTSGWSDFQRAWGPWWDSVQTGFMSSYRAIGDLFGGDSYFKTGDYQSAIEFAEANRLGSSTRGGLSGFGTNLFLQSGYTVGIIGSIAAEELALAAATAATGGGASGGFLARTLYNFGRGMKALGNMFDVRRAIKGTSSLLDTLRSAEKAKDFWTAAKTAGVGTAKFAGDIFTPELRATLKAFKTGENTIQGLEVLAKGATYGAFYRDLRAINLAMSESKMEGGLVYADTFAEQIAKKNGEVATVEELEEINKAALDAASTTILLNAPFIYATNKLVLGTALSGFSPTLRRIFNQSLPGFAKNFIKSKPVRDAATGKAARDIFKNVGAKSALGKLTGFKKLRAIGIGKGTAHNLLRYSAASLGEGVQEVYQEGVAVGVVDYYTKLLDNPQANQTDLMYESIRSGLKSQMSAQGAEVFMSGFLMGGLVQGPQKVLFETIPEVYQRKRNPEAYKKYQENMEKFEARVNEVGNDIQDNPFDYFNDKRLNLFFQKDTQEDAERNLFEADPMGFYDAKDASAFMNRYFMMSSGTESLYLEQLEDISKLSKEELKEMFPQFEDIIEEGKGQEYIQRSIDDLKKFTKEYQASYDKIVNPYNFKQYKKGSREYNQTRQKHLAVEHARLLYLFAGDSFAQALNRRDKLNNYLKTSGVMGDQLDTDDLTVLLSTDSIDAETKLLLQEVQVLKQAEEKDEKLIKEKEDRLIALAGYRAALENTYDAESDVYDREKIETLRKPLIQYLEKLAENKGGFVKEDLIDEVLYALVDHNNLDKRAQLYSRTVSLFSNPDKVTDIIDRIGDHLKVLFDNNKAQFEKNVKGAVEDAEANQVVLQFKELGVYPDAAQVLEFLKTKDVSNLKDFYTENGKVFPQADPELWSKIQAILNNYTQTKEDLAKAKQEKEEAKKETATPEQAFDEIDSQEIPDDLQAEMDEAPDANLLVEDQSPFAQEILLNLYAKYKLDQFSKGEEYLPLDEWINSREGRGAVKALEKLKKIWYVSLTKSNLTEEQIEKAYKEDDGFQSWLMSQKEDPLVSRALMLGGIRFSDVEMDTTGVGLDSVVEDDPNKRWIQKGPGINILERRVGDPTSEEDQQIMYTLTDNNGVQLSDQELQRAGVSKANEISLDKAVESYKKLLQNRPEDSTYEFDGVELKYLDEVEDAQGNKFIVLGTSVSTDKGAKLKLLRFEDRELQGQDREAASFFAEETSFSDLYSKVEQSFKGVTFTENMSKLDPKDMSALYGRRFEGDTEKGINPNERLARALSVLSEEDLASATIVIIRNDRREPIKLQIGITPENAFVNDKGDKYHIEIVLEQDAANKVQQALEDSIYAYPEDFGGSIGFIANDQYSFTGVKGKEINISAIEDSKIERYITPEGSTAADLKNAAAQQAYFIGKVDELMKDSNNKAFKMAEFREATDFDIVLTNGKFEQGKEPVSLEELDHNTFDGNMIIMINTKQKGGGLGKSYVTNLEEGEAEFIASVEEQLRKQSVSGGQSNLFNEARTLGRYVAIIKSPNGAITLAQLKQAPYSQEERVALYDKLIKKAQDVRDGKVEKKDLYAWNDEFNTEFYIPINPNLSPAFLDLKVDLKGNIVLRIKVGKSAPTAFISQVKVTPEQLDEYAKNPATLASLFTRLSNNPAVKKFNESSPYKLNFTEESLLQVFPIDAAIDEIVGKTKTDLDRRVRFGQKVYMTTSADLSSAEGIVNNSVEDSTSDEFVETPAEEVAEEVADKVEENTDLQTMDDTLYEEFKKNDFQDISSDITRAIAAKVVSEGRDSLTDREAEVLKSREDIEALIGMASMQSSTPTEESTLDKQIEEAQQELEKEKALIEAEWAKTKKNRRVLKRESESYQAALNKLRALEKKRNDLNAFKVLDPTESFGEEYTLESFLVWAKENLPEFIQVRDLEELHTRLTERGIQVGQFTMYLRRLAGNLDIEGTIYTGVGNSYRYHEAFHAVYRLLLTDEEQAKLRRLAKDEVRKKFKTREAYLNELSRFKNLHPKYRAMSSKDLENEYLEEYMADEFEKFKTNPRDTKTNSAIKSFFNRLLQWIRSVLKGYRGNELTNLFEAIDSRKFKNAAIQDNIYTRGLQNDVIVDVFKIIPYEVISGDKMTSAKYLDPSTANLLIRMIGNTYVERRQDTKYEELNDKDLLGTIIDEYGELYNPEQEKYNSLSEKDFDKLENIYDALIMNEGEAVADAVEQHLEIVNIKIEEQEDEVDQLEDEFGPRRVGDYNKDANQFGGSASASKNIRMFIASVAIDSKDMFGNVELLDGQKIKVPVDHIDVYNGLMLAAMNKTNTADILKAMYIFSRRNEHSGAVVDEFFRRTGIDAETLMETNELPKKIKNSKLFNEFLKTFTNSRVDYIFHFEQEDNPSNVAIFSASNRDAANSQIDYWKKSFNDKFELFRTNRQKLNEAISVVNALDKLLNKKTITNKLLSSESNRLSKEIFDKLGIKLSPLYLEISIASSLSGVRTKYQEQLVQLGSDKRLMTSEDSNILVNMLSAEEIIVNGKKKTNIPKPQNLFIDDQGAGMSSRLKSIALGNALFDESVGNTVFEDPNGNLVYAHQKQTYHLKRINELNEAGTISDLSEQFELNSLLNNPIFRQMSKDNQLGIIRVAGLNAGKIKTNEEDNTLEDYTASMGQTYGDFKSVDFIRTLINLYVADYNTKSGKNNIVEAEGQSAATAPVLIRILESANTGDMISLPVSTTIQDGTITESTVDVFTDIIEKEYNIIRDNFEAGLGTIKNYNDTDQGNGFKFFKGDNLISLETKTDLIAKAKEGVQWKDISRDDIAKEVAQVLEATAQDFVNLVKANGINVSSLVQGNFAQTDSTEKAMAELNLVRNNVEQNLKQIFLNNWMNTLAINELILGEEARLFKDAVIDPIKRAKMQNAAHDSVSFDVIPEEELGIEHTLGDESIALMTITDPAFEQRYTNGAVPGNRNGDKADAQTYITAKGARYFAYGLGQLNEEFAEMLDKIERGEEITSEDWFGKYQPANAYLNSKKYVYGDGQTFLKMSTVVLTKEETSVEVDGILRPRPGMEELHYMRENMEAFEAENQGKVAIVAPTSAVKMLKQNILPVETLSGSRNIITQDEVTLLNARDFGRQMINPSNKLEITIPTQIKSLITSEQYQGEDFKVRIAGEDLSMNDVRKEYHRLVAAGVRFDYTQKRNLIFDLLPHIDGNIINELERSGSIEPNLATFIRTAQANLKASAAGSNMIEFFADENGEMKYDLNNPITISKFEQFFLAYFSKKVLAQKTPGMSLALKSDFGKGVIRKVYSLDAEGNIDKQEVIRKKNFDKSGQSVTIDIRTEEGMQELRDALANNPGQSVTVIDRLRINLPEYDKVTEDPSTWVKTNIRYAEAIIPAHYKEVMDLIENKNVPIPDAIAKMFAVRIPSQDKHSSMAVRLVDFDPVYNGSTGVFPEELIEISGADFDIDKVYTAIKEWYVKEGKFIEYGSRTGQEGFEDYVNYTNKKVAKKGSYLYDAASKYDQGGLVSIDKSFDASERIELENLGYSDDAINALYVLNLPKTLAEYNKYIENSGLEPYRAPMINRILDMNFALQGNTKLTESETGVPISYQPADVEALKEEWNTLSEQFPFLKALTLEEGISIDNLIGQYFTHKNVKENANLIGAVVPPNVIFNFLKEQGVSLRKEFGSFFIDGKPYNTLVDNENGIKELRRSQYIISNLISAATDDAKERLLSKLGYVKKAIKAVETMVAYGVPLHTATMLINTDTIRRIISEDNYGGELKLAIAELVNKGIEPVAVTTKSIEKAMVAGEASEAELLGIYQLMNKVNTVVSFADEMISIFRLNNGFGKDFSALRDRQQNIDALGLYIKGDVFKEMRYRGAPMPMDLRKAFGINTPMNEPTSHFIGEYLRINKEFTESILPQIFLTQTPEFKEMYESVMSYTYTQLNARGSKLKTKIHKDILAYITLKAYMKQVFETEAGAVIGGSLSNEFIYPGESNFNINKVITDLRAKYQDRDNYFLDYFLYNRPFDSADNKTGMNTIVTNSFGKLSDNEKVRIQNGFQSLYGERETRADAMHILHYIMIKDGLQYDFGSVLDAITPFGLEKYLQASKNAFAAFKGDKSFEDVFGMSFIELSNELASNYGESTSHARNLVTVNTKMLTQNKHSITQVDKGASIVIQRQQRSDAPKLGFPRFMQIKDFVTGGSTYYRLTQAADVNGKESTSIDINAILGRVVADKVTYERFVPKGSFKQSAIGFMFDNENFSRPTLDKLQVGANREMFEDPFGGIDPMDVDDFAALEDFAYDQNTLAKLEAFNQGERTATEKGIEIDGVNIADAKAPAGIEDATSKLEAFIQQGEQVEDPIEEVEEGEQLELNLDVDSLQEFYEIIQTQDLDVEALQDAGISINSLESFRKSFENSKFTTEEEFTEHIKKCYLK